MDIAGCPYSHVLPGMYADAAAPVDGAFRTALEMGPRKNGSKKVANSLFRIYNKKYSNVFSLLLRWGV